MNIDVIIEDEAYTLNVPDALIEQATDFFDRMDKDMDAGWQLSQFWVENPNQIQRCQVVADKLYSAIENEDDKTGRLMAGYICNRMPDIASIEIDITGDIQGHQFTYGQSSAEQTDPGLSFSSPMGSNLTTEDMLGPKPGDMDKDSAMKQAEEEVSTVYKVGRQYRFSMLNKMTGEWVDAATTSSEEEANKIREQALRNRFYELSGGA